MKILLQAIILARSNDPDALAEFEKSESKIMPTVNDYDMFNPQTC